jgi:hypothetical protein
LAVGLHVTLLNTGIVLSVTISRRTLYETEGTRTFCQCSGKPVANR